MASKPRAFLASILILTFASAAVAASPAPLADRLPASPLIYLGWAGTNKAWNETAIAKLLADPAAQKILGVVHDMAAKEVRGDDDADLFERGWRMGMTAVKHPIAVTVTEFKMDGGMPEVHGAVLIDLGEDRKAFDQDLQALLGKNGMPLEDANVGGISCKKLALPGASLALGYVGNVLFVTVGDDVLAQVIAPAADKSLAADKAFAEALKPVVGENPQMVVYADVQGILQRVEPLVNASITNPRDPNLREMITALGVGKIRSIAGCCNVVGSGLQNRLRLATPAPHQGVLMLLAGAPLKDQDLAEVPSDALFCAAVSLDAKAILGEVKRIVAALDKRGQADLDKGLAEVDKMLGVSLEKDVLGNLGSSWVLSSAISQGGFYTGTVLSVPVKDEAAMKATLSTMQLNLQTKLEVNSPYVIRGTRCADANVQYISFGRHVPLAPAWTVHKGRLYIAPFPQVLQSVFTSTQKGLAKSPAYAQVRPKVGATSSIMTFVDGPQIIRETYHWLLLGSTIFAGEFSRQGLEMTPDFMPSLQTLEKFISPSIGSVSADEGGILIESFSNLP